MCHDSWLNYILFFLALIFLRPTDNALITALFLSSSSRGMSGANESPPVAAHNLSLEGKMLDCCRSSASEEGALRFLSFKEPQHQGW